MRYVPLNKVAIIDRTIASTADCEVLPYVGLEHIEKENGHFVDGYERKADTLLSTKFLFTHNHVLYGKLRPYLNKVSLPDFKGVCTTEILPILPISKELDRGYLWAYLLSPNFVNWASSQVSGANLPRLDPKLLSEYEIPLPPLPEQRRIAAILQKADRLRRLRRYALQLSEGYLQSLFLKMFCNKNFTIMLLEDMLLADPKNGIYLPATLYGSGCPIIRIDTFYNGILNNPKSFKRVFANQKQIEEFSVKNGDILINRVNSLEYLGKCALVEGITEITIFESNMMRITVDKDLVLPEYLTGYLITKDAYRQIIQFSKEAVNQASINQQDVKAIRIPLPPISLQLKYAQLREKNKSVLIFQTESLRQSELLFQTLLHRAFAGEL